MSFPTVVSCFSFLKARITINREYRLKERKWEHEENESSRTGNGDGKTESGTKISEGKK